MKSILGIALEEKRNLTEDESYSLLSKYGIPVPKYKVAFSLEEAIEKAKFLGFPLVMKVISPDIIHKTEFGGVMLNIKNEQQVQEFYQNMIFRIKKSKPEVKIHGVLLYNQLPEGVEVIVGMTRDAQFGPTVMFGLGGIFTEVLQDVTFRICPVTRIDIKEMIHDIKGIKMLKGYRGQSSCDLNTLIDIIMTISEISLNYSIIKTIDLNPIIVYEKGAVVVDAKVLLN